MLEITMGTVMKGLKMRFKNGTSISVQMGMGSYSDAGRRGLSNELGRGLNVLEQIKQKTKRVSGDNAEVAIFNDKTGEWITMNCPAVGSGDDVSGYVEADEIVDAIIWAKSLTKTALMCQCVERYRRGHCRCRF